MYIFLVILHVIVCLVLIMVVLLQAGRGGGMSEMIGGGQPQSLFGTQTNQFMTRATEVCAVIFIITSLSLGVLSTHRGKSLMERRGAAGLVQKTLPAIPATGATAATATAASTADVDFNSQAPVLDKTDVSGDHAGHDHAGHDHAAPPAPVAAPATAEKV